MSGSSPDITQERVTLLHTLCMANDPVDSRTSPCASLSPHASPAQAHLSAISPPLMPSLGSIHPVDGTGSLIDSVYSWPPTRLNPSSVPAVPAFSQFLPQNWPASSS